MRWYGRHCGRVGEGPRKEASELIRCAVSSHRSRITRVSTVNSTFPVNLPSTFSPILQSSTLRRRRWHGPAQQLCLESA